MYKLAKQYTKSVTKQYSPEKESHENKKPKVLPGDIMKLQKKALLNSISNFKKHEGIDKQGTKLQIQSIKEKIGLEKKEEPQVDIINSIEKKKKFFKVKQPQKTEDMTTKQLMDRANDNVLDKYLDQIDGHNLLL